MKNQKPQHRINEQIRTYEVRLVGNGESKIINTIEALGLAKDQEMDLILINENQNPPIAKIGDYKKFLYEQAKAEKERKKNSIKSVLKEIQLSQDIADNDLNTKANKAKEFLQHGDKVKCTLTLKGRQRSSPERGQITILKFATILEEFGTIENLPKLENSKWIMIVKPKKK